MEHAQPAGEADHDAERVSMRIHTSDDGAEIAHRSRHCAMKTAAQLGTELREAGRDSAVRVLGPAPAPLARLKGEHRFQILIKARRRKSAREALDRAMERCIALGHNQRSISVEVDPVSLM